MLKAKEPKKESMRKHVVVAALSMVGGGAYAQSMIDLPAQPLPTALSQLAREANVNILAPDSLVAGKPAPAVSGQLTVDEALGRILRGTGLQVEHRDAKTYVIVVPKSSTPNSNTSSTPVLPAINVSDGAVTQAQTGFAATTTSSATRTDTPISELPQSVQVITQDVMKSQQATTVADVLSNVSGVSVSPNSDTATSAVYIRGFLAPVSTDGLANVSTYSVGGVGIPLIGIDHIDVVKGADSILAGDMAPGGLVNVVRKRPQADTLREITLQTGSYGEALVGLDLTGALSSANHINYRFIVQGERSGNGNGAMDAGHNFYIAPSIGYKTESTDFVIGFEQKSNRTPFMPFSFIVNGTPYDKNGLLDQKDDHSLGNSTSVYYSLEQKIFANWTFRSKAAYTAQATAFSGYSVYPISDTGGDTYSLAALGDVHVYETSLEESMMGKFRTGPLSHTLVAGFSYQRAEERHAQDYLLDLGGLGNVLTGIQPELPSIGGSVNDTEGATTYESQIYLHDQINVGDRLHLLASIAHNRDGAQATTYGTPSESAWTPNLGILYQLTGNLGIYASYLKSFTNQALDQLANGDIAPPAIGKTVEVGLKGNFLNDRLTSSIAVFRTAQTNIIYYNELGLGYLDPGGEVSRGVEVDVSGKILPGWNVIANYTYSDPQGLDGDPYTLPRHKMRLWTTYELQGANLHGLGVGVGMSARSAYAISDTWNSAVVDHVPGQASFDASIFYKTKTWTGTFGVKDIANRRLYADYGAFINLPVAALGRTFLLTVTHDF